MKKRTGLKDIAEALNISVTTVSRALNDKFDINAKTKELVLEKAAELNYRPNAYAVSLRKNEYHTIGVILPNLDHYFFSTVLKGIMNKAHMANYLVLIGESSHNVKKEAEIIEQFNAHCVNGVIISPSMLSNYEYNLEYLRRKRIPFVLVDRPSGKQEDAFVRYDDSKGAYLAIEHLLDQGYKKIAVIKGNDQCTISNARLDGYKNALNDHNIEIDPRLIKSCYDLDSELDGYHLSRELLISNNRPDAIFTITDNMASGVYKSARELGLMIPQDIGVVGYSNSKMSSMMTPCLTSVEQPGKDMGEQAFDFLQQCIIDDNKKLNKTFEARLIVRPSSLKSAQFENKPFLTFNESFNRMQ